MTDTRETSYSSKQAAIKAMWRYYDRHICSNNGSPLVGEGGTVLQWVDNARGVTRHMSVTTDQNGLPILIKSWVE